ncbi:protein SIX6OS1 isoform X1 [Thunnus albacares]|uniref:protein SIX6OS1 isoform X1 n=1 Tax=Thunnus albacares TaxID=8236 RepID=UPI001CF6BAB4|nr:protein SIX6OS1 isoform X1 [Thunnus albacares]
MNDQFSLSKIDSFLFQLVLQTRELSQKKNEINQQITVCRADIAKRRSYIETVQTSIKKLEEEIRVKQSTGNHNKANAKSMKATNSLLLQYEHTLKAELESAKASYNQDMEIYEERISRYRTIFQSHKDHYCQNPLAQKLLMLHAEKEEIEFRIKACDDQITMKQMELENLTGPAINSSSTETLPDSVSGQQPVTEPEEDLDPQTEDDNDSSIDISSLHLNQTKIWQNGDTTAVEANAEEVHDENKAQDALTCSNSPEKASNEQYMWSYQQPDEQSRPDEMQAEEQEQETGPGKQVLSTTFRLNLKSEKRSAISEVEEAVEEEMEERVAAEEEQAPSKEDNERLTAFCQSSSQEIQSSPATVKTVPSTSTFPFNISPGCSPHQGTSDTKSPAFLFALNSGPSTPGFSGFGFDMGSSQEEDSSFPFTSSFFSEKKMMESKSSGPDFLFDQPEQSEDFQFTFSSKSPQTTNRENTSDEFPFSFNF